MEWLWLLCLVPIAFFWCCSSLVACEACVNFQVSRCFTVVISGVTNNGCLDCAGLNGTYEVCQTRTSANICHWELDLDPDVCIFTKMDLAIQGSATVQGQVKFIFSNADGSESVTWIKAYCSPPPGCRVSEADCTAASDLALTFNAFLSTAGATAQCTFSASSCLVTSVT